MHRWRWLVVLGAVGLAGSLGCATLGPKTVPRDRFEYSSAISESWMRQNLLNIVKLRYVEPPVFVDVNSMVSGYSLETTVSAGVNVPEGPDNNILSLGGAGRYTDRPTITYTPLTGNKFVRGLMTPIPPASLFFTIQAGWRADALLFIGVSSMNGLKNRAKSIAGTTEGDPKFFRVLELFQTLQSSGYFGLRVRDDPDKKGSSTLITFLTADAPAEARAAAAELQELLGLDPASAEYRLVFGAVANDRSEIAVQTRSLLQIMGLIAADVDAPPDHVKEGRATPGRESQEHRLIKILSGREEPVDTMVKVKYREYWFWIDDRDLPSKRTFSMMMLLFTLADTGEAENLPLITIPAQ